MDATVLHALTRLGVTLLLVPAMSETTSDFESRAMSAVADSQSISVVANGPVDWDTLPDDEPPAAAIYGQPVRQHRVITATPGADEVPGITFLKVAAHKAEYMS